MQNILLDRGETLTIYLVGLEATSPLVESGTAAPSNPPATVLSKVEITVDGQPAAVSFSGLTPGGVGLYQINLQVPMSAKSGNLAVVIAEGDGKANTAILIVER